MPATNRPSYKAALLTVALLFCLLPSHAQWERYGGVYTAYPSEEKHGRTPVPEGFRPFYISLFARHGSRWLPDDRRYEAVWQVFADTAALTPLGRDVRRRLRLICDDARGRGGCLTAIGVRQHRGLAERMVAEYPEVFEGEAHVEARSSTVGRCAMSMTAFTLRLAQLRPHLDITAESCPRYMDYIAYTSPEQQLLEDTAATRWTMDPSRLMASLFVHPEQVEHPRGLASELHTLASSMQDVGLGLSLYDLFTEEEMRQIYDMHNRRMQLCNGIHPDNHGIPARCAASLWRNIVESADSAIALGRPAATLRFGHDTSLYRLLTRMGLLAGECRMDRIIPMGANLQMIFYRDGRGRVIVKCLHNEAELALPTVSSSDATIRPPYYLWDDVKRALPAT